MRNRDWDHLKSCLVINVYRTNNDRRGRWEIETAQAKNTVASAKRITDCTRKEIAEYAKMAMDFCNPISYVVGECLEELNKQIRAVFVEDGDVIFK